MAVEYKDNIIPKYHKGDYILVKYIIDKTSENYVAQIKQCSRMTMIVDFMVMKRFENNYIVFEWSNAAVDKLAEIDIDQVVKKLASFSQPPVINVGGKNVTRPVYETMIDRELNLMSKKWNA